MVKYEDESLTEILHELEKNKFVKLLMERWHEQTKLRMQNTLIVVSAVLITILLLNFWGKLSMESNGWIIAALIGYLFGRSSPN